MNVPEEEKHDGVLLFGGSPDGSDKVDAKLFQLGCAASLGYSLTHPFSVTCLLAALLV